MFGANLNTIPPGVNANAALEHVRQRVFGPDGPAPNSMEAKVEYLRSEHMLVRFLIARQWDVEKTVAMLREHYRWLAETKMEILLNDPFPEEVHIKKYYPQAYHGTDKKGRPIYIERPGLIDMVRLLQVTTAERLLQYMQAATELQIRRRLPACSLVRGEVVDKSLSIMDLDGLGFRVVTHTTARRVLKEFVTMLQNHYPECSGKMVIINAPKVFSIAWSFVKPMLDDKTVAKISIFGSDQKEACRAALLDLVDAEQLPALFGGSCICDGKDKESCMRCVKGPWVDPEVLAVLAEVPVERVMTPAGAKSLLERRARAAEAVDSNVQAEGGTVAEEPPALELEGEVEIPEAEADEALDSTAGLPELPAIRRPRAGSAEQEALEQAERDVAALVVDHSMQEQVHMRTLTEWVEEYNTLVQDIGRHVIERAQGYYDSRSLWQQVVQEFASCQEVLDTVNRDLDCAIRALGRGEVAFEAQMTGGAGDLTEAEWEELAPLEADEVAGLAEAGGDKLIRMFRVSKLTDQVTHLQRQRDAATAELAMKRRELEEVRRRFEAEESQHNICTWNCSVKRALPFYDKRRMHEFTVDTQLAALQSVEQRLAEARQRLQQLQLASSGNGTRTSNRSARPLDELSLQSFEIAGGEPGEDEFCSCDEDDSDEGT